MGSWEGRPWDQAELCPEKQQQARPPREPGQVQVGHSRAEDAAGGALVLRKVIEDPPGGVRSP